MMFAFFTNLLVSAMLIVGGSDTVTALTGMPTIAGCFLIILGVAIYTITGGLRSTLIAD